MENGRAYRVHHELSSKDGPEYQKVSGPEEGLRMIKVLINRDLEDITIDSNSFGVEVYGEDGWEEWTNEAGLTTMSIIEQEEKEEN